MNLIELSQIRISDCEPSPHIAITSMVPIPTLESIVSYIPSNVQEHLASPVVFIPLIVLGFLFLSVILPRVCGSSDMGASKVVKYNTDFEKREQLAQEVSRNFYDLVTDFYEYGWGQSFHFATQKKGQEYTQATSDYEVFIGKKLGLRKGMKVLDVGCGIGGPRLNFACKMTQQFATSRRPSKLK